MSHLQIISLFKNKSAAEVTADEIDFVNEYLEQHPALIDTLGGQSVVDDFLLAASETETPAITDSPETAQALYDAPARPWIFRITAVLILLLIGWTAWFGIKQAGFDVPGSTEDAAQADDSSVETSSTAETLKQEKPQPGDGRWHGWKIETADGSPVVFQPDWIFSDEGKPTSRLVPLTKGQPTTFSISRHVKKDDWLALHLEAVETSATPGLIEISINDELYNRVPVPAQTDKDPYLIPLHDYQDQQLQLQLTFKPGDDKEQLQWNRLQFFQHPRSTKWYPLEMVNLRSQAGTELVIGDDKIITAERGGPGIETYVAHVTTSLPNVTAFRLEAFPELGVTETRRPRNRKWNYLDTSFVLSNFRVMTAASEHRKISGRYVKLMTNEERTYLSLAEVQVFSGGKNVALQGKASQSVPDKKMGAAMAIDNRLTADGYRTEDGKYARSMVKTRGKKGPAWWKVDLGKTYDIDRIVVHGPTAYSQRINPFYVMVLNESNDPANDLVWESELIQQPPSPSLELTDSDSKSLILSTASTDMLGHNDMVKDSLLTTPSGWNLPEYFQKTQHAVFTLREAAATGPAGFVVHLGHNMHSRAPTLGKFRLSVTNAQPPFQFAPPGLVVLSHDQQLSSIAVAQSPGQPSQPQVTQPKPNPLPQAERKAAEAKAAEAKAAAANVAEAKAAEQKPARQQAAEVTRLAEEKAAEARQLAQQKRLEALRVAQQKRQDALKKAREKRAADAKRRAEQLAARRKADAKKREEDAKKRADEAKRRAKQEAARRKADAKKREDDAKNGRTRQSEGQNKRQPARRPKKQNNHPAKQLSS
jgi:hypothetical protein